MKRAILGLALAALLPVSAQAADGTGAVSYSYLEAAYVSTDILDEDFDGFGVAGSVDFGNNWYASASYRRVDDNDLDVDFDQSNINLGWRHAISDKADFVAEIGYVNYGVDIVGFDDSADGYRVAAGFRGMLAPQFEAGIKASYTDGSDLDGEFGIGVNAVWHFNPTWGITGSYEHGEVLDEGMDTWTLGVRASF